MTRPRLRDQPLTKKPRIVGNRTGQHYVERATEHGPEVVCKTTFPEAISLALLWAGPKKEASK